MTLPFSPAAERNKRPILALLASLLPGDARVLEVASGTGQHAEHFASAHPAWVWQPTDACEADLESIANRLHGLGNALPALRLDVLMSPWPVPGRFDAVYCANMLHIAPWPTCAALMRGAAACLKPGGVLVTYGPYFVEGESIAPSNLAFDADLRRRNPAWGLRRLDDVVVEAARAGLVLERRWEMPSHNLMLAFRSSPGSSP